MNYPISLSKAEISLLLDATQFHHDRLKDEEEVIPDLQLGDSSSDLIVESIRARRQALQALANRMVQFRDEVS